MEQTLAGLGSRVFLMNNVHEDAPVVFQTRWALSYLRGPLTRQQISQLMDARKKGANAQAEESSVAAPVVQEQLSAQETSVSETDPPMIPADIPVVYVPPKARINEGDKIVYRPALLGRGAAL
ncbi:MAG: hypothetical protein R3C11_29685 [Planctomycetaceae bacterium]